MPNDMCFSNNQNKGHERLQHLKMALSSEKIHNICMILAKLILKMHWLLMASNDVADMFPRSTKAKKNVEKMFRSSKNILIKCDNSKVWSLDSMQLLRKLLKCFCWADKCELWIAVSLNFLKIISVKNESYKLL